MGRDFRYYGERPARDSALFLKVDDLINIATGTKDKNVIDFKMLQFILYILAGHVSILEQMVELRLPRSEELRTMEDEYYDDVKRGGGAQKLSEKEGILRAPEGIQGIDEIKTGRGKEKYKDAKREKGESNNDDYNKKGVGRVKNLGKKDEGSDIEVRIKNDRDEKSRGKYNEKDRESESENGVRGRKDENKNREFKSESSRKKDQNYYNSEDDSERKKYKDHKRREVTERLDADISKRSKDNSFDSSGRKRNRSLGEDVSVREKRGSRDENINRDGRIMHGSLDRSEKLREISMKIKREEKNRSHEKFSDTRNVISKKSPKSVGSDIGSFIVQVKQMPISPGRHRRQGSESGHIRGDKSGKYEQYDADSAEGGRRDDKFQGRNAGRERNIDGDRGGSERRAGGRSGGRGGGGGGRDWEDDFRRRRKCDTGSRRKKVKGEGEDDEEDSDEQELKIIQERNESFEAGGLWQCTGRLEKRESFEETEGILVADSKGNMKFVPLVDDKGRGRGGRSEKTLRDRRRDDRDYDRDGRGKDYDTGYDRDRDYRDDRFRKDDDGRGSRGGWAGDRDEWSDRDEEGGKRREKYRDRGGRSGWDKDSERGETDGDRYGEDRSGWDREREGGGRDGRGGRKGEKDGKGRLSVDFSRDRRGLLEGIGKERDIDGRGGIDRAEGGRGGIDRDRKEIYGREDQDGKGEIDYEGREREGDSLDDGGGSKVEDVAGKAGKRGEDDSWSEKSGKMDRERAEKAGDRDRKRGGQGSKDDVSGKVAIYDDDGRKGDRKSQEEGSRKVNEDWDKDRTRSETDDKESDRRGQKEGTGDLGKTESKGEIEERDGKDTERSGRGGKREKKGDKERYRDADEERGRGIEKDGRGGIKGDDDVYERKGAESRGREEKESGAGGRFGVDEDRDGKGKGKDEDRDGKDGYEGETGVSRDDDRSFRRGGRHSDDDKEGGRYDEESLESDAGVTYVDKVFPGQRRERGKDDRSKRQKSFDDRDGGIYDGKGKGGKEDDQYGKAQDGEVKKRDEAIGSDEDSASVKSGMRGKRRESEVGKSNRRGKDGKGEEGDENMKRDKGRGDDDEGIGKGGRGQKGYLVESDEDDGTGGRDGKGRVTDRKLLEDEDDDRIGKGKGERKKDQGGRDTEGLVGKGDKDRGGKRRKEGEKDFESVESGKRGRDKDSESISSKGRKLSVAGKGGKGKGGKGGEGYEDEDETGGRGGAGALAGQSDAAWGTAGDKGAAGKKGLKGRDASLTSVTAGAGVASRGGKGAAGRQGGEKFIEKSKKKISIIKKSTSSIDLKRGNVHLQKQTLELQRQLDEMSEKQAVTAAQLEELQLATSELLQLSTANRLLTSHLLEDSEDTNLLGLSIVDLTSPADSSTDEGEDDTYNYAVAAPVCQSPQLLSSPQLVGISAASPTAPLYCEQSPPSSRRGRRRRRRRRRRRACYTPTVSSQQATDDAAATPTPLHNRGTTDASECTRSSDLSAPQSSSTGPPVQRSVGALNNESRRPSAQASAEQSLRVPGKKTVVYSDGIAAGGREGSMPRVGSIEVVTQSQFHQLEQAVLELQKKAGPMAAPIMPENKQLLKDITRGNASLTDVIQALQLQARLQAAERAIDRMADLIAQLAAAGALTPEMLSKVAAIHSEVAEGYKDVPLGPGGKAEQVKQLRKRLTEGSIRPGSSAAAGIIGALETAESGATRRVSVPAKSGRAGGSARPSKLPGMMLERFARLPTASSGGLSRGASKRSANTVGSEDCITAQEMDDALAALREEFERTVAAMTSRANNSAEHASQVAKTVADKLDTALHLNERVSSLYNMVDDHTEQLNGFDAGVATQIEGFQQQMGEMKNDLKEGLEQLQNVNNNAETAAVIELTERYDGLVADLDATLHNHQNMTTHQNQLSDELRSLLECVEMLRESKADRDEVLDGLRDKADISRLDGLLTEDEFAQARAQLELRMQMCYDKFRAQDNVWMGAVKEISNVISNKAEVMQLMGTRDDMQEQLHQLNRKCIQLTKVLGEPKAAVLARKLAKDGTCAACKLPAIMEPTDISTVAPPALPALRRKRPEPTGADSDVCLKNFGPGGRISATDLPSLSDADEDMKDVHICKRWVGGSHTLLTSQVTREKAQPLQVHTLPMRRYVGPGTDGKLYMLAEACIPCAECNTLYVEKIPGEIEVQTGGATPVSDITVVTGTEARRVTIISESDLPARVNEEEIVEKLPSLVERQSLVSEPQNSTVGKRLSMVERPSIVEKQFAMLERRQSMIGNRPSQVEKRISLVQKRSSTEDKASEEIEKPHVDYKLKGENKSATGFEEPIPRRLSDIGIIVKGRVTLIDEEAARRAEVRYETSKLDHGAPEDQDTENTQKKEDV